MCVYFISWKICRIPSGPFPAAKCDLLTCKLPIKNDYTYVGVQLMTIFIIYLSVDYFFDQ